MEPFWKLEAALLPDAGLRGSQEGSTPVNRTKVPESRARLGHFLREMQLHEAWRLRRVRRRRWRGGPSVAQPALRLLGLQVPVAPSGLRLGVLHGACEGDLEVSSGLGFLSQQQGLVPRRARSFLPRQTLSFSSCVTLMSWRSRAGADHWGIRVIIQTSLRHVPAQIEHLPSTGRRRTPLRVQKM